MRFILAISLLLFSLTSVGQLYQEPLLFGSVTPSTDTTWGTFDPDTKGTYIALSNGNQTATKTSATCSRASYDVPIEDSLRYIECRAVVGSIGVTNTVKVFGFYAAPNAARNSDCVVPTNAIFFVLLNTGMFVYDTTGVIASWNIESMASGDTAMFAVDMVNGAIYMGWNGVWKRNSSLVYGVPTSGASKTGAIYTWTPDSREYYFTVGGAGLPEYYTANSGQQAWTYTIPTGYKGVYTVP